MWLWKGDMKDYCVGIVQCLDSGDVYTTYTNDKITQNLTYIHTNAGGTG